MDKYFDDETIFNVRGLPIVVRGNFLAEILAQLPKDKLEVILLFYFLNMNDREISEQLNVVRQTICKRRLLTLKELRNYFTEEE